MPNGDWIDTLPSRVKGSGNIRTNDWIDSLPKKDQQQVQKTTGEDNPNKQDLETLASTGSKTAAQELAKNYGDSTYVKNLNSNTLQAETDNQQQNAQGYKPSIANQNLNVLTDNDNNVYYGGQIKPIVSTGQRDARPVIQQPPLTAKEIEEYKNLNLPQTSVTDVNPNQQRLQNVSDLLHKAVTGEGEGAFLNPLGAVIQGVKGGTEQIGKGVQQGGLNALLQGYPGLATMTPEEQTGILNIASGAFKTGMSLYPELAAINAVGTYLTPVAEHVGNQIGGEEGKKIASTITQIGTAIPMGLPMTVGMIANMGGEALADKVLEGKKLSDEEKGLLKELVGQIGFFGGAMLGGAGEGIYQNLKENKSKNQEAVKPVEPTGVAQIPPEGVGLDQLTDLPPQTAGRVQTKQDYSNQLPENKVSADPKSRMIVNRLDRQLNDAIKNKQPFDEKNIVNEVNNVIDPKERLRLEDLYKRSLEHNQKIKEVQNAVNEGQEQRGAQPERKGNDAQVSPVGNDRIVQPEIGESGIGAGKRNSVQQGSGGAQEKQEEISTPEAAGTIGKRLTTEEYNALKDRINKSNPFEQSGEDNTAKINKMLDEGKKPSEIAKELKIDRKEVAKVMSGRKQQPTGDKTTPTELSGKTEGQPEEIIAAAIKTPEGKIIRGSSHPTIEAENKIPENSENGFLTSNGRFVNREEASTIAKQSKQISENAPSKIDAYEFSPYGIEELQGKPKEQSPSVSKEPAENFYIRNTLVKKSEFDKLSPEKKSEILKLKDEYDKLGYVDATTQIGPDQARRMTGKQKSELGDTTSKVFRIEDRVKQLLKSDEQIKKEQENTNLENAKSRMSQLNRQIEDINNVGRGKNGKLRPSYQRTLDLVNTERDKILKDHPDLAEEYGQKPAENAQSEVSAKNAQSKNKPKPLKENESNELLRAIFTKLQGDPEKQITNVKAIYDVLPDKYKTIADKIKSIAEQKLQPRGEGSEEAKIETAKLNKAFEDEQKRLAPYVSDRTPEEIIADKIADGKKLSAKEKKIYEETQYAPEGFKYDTKGNLQKIKEVAPPSENPDITEVKKTQGTGQKEGVQTTPEGNKEANKIAEKANRFISEESYQKAKENLTKNLGKLSAGVDPTNLKDLTTVGAYHVENGLRDFAEWSKKMVEDFGEKIKPHLKDIWDSTRKSFPDVFKPEGKAKVTPEGKITETQSKRPAGVAKASWDLNRKLVEQGFNELPESELAAYNPTTKKYQIEKTADLITNDYDKAKNISLGLEATPGDLQKQTIFNAVKNKAFEDKDSETLRQLALSPVAAERSRIAQQLGAAGYNNGEMPVDPVKAMRDVANAREKSFGRQNLEKVSANYEKRIQDLEKKIQEKDDQLKQIEAQKAYTKIKREASFQARRERRTYTKEQLKEERGKLYTDLYKELSTLNAGVPITGKGLKILGELTKNYAQEGLLRIEDVVDAIHNELKDKIEGITPRDIRDAISRYGQETVKKSKDEIQKSIQDLRRQGKIISQIEDIEKGKIPETKKTEPYRSEALQSLKNKLKETLDKEGITEQKNLSRAKELINKKILEYNEKIKEGDYSKEKKIPPMDTEKANLQKQLEDVRNRWNHIRESLGEIIKPEEAKQITDLSQKITEAKIKMDAVPRRKTLGRATPEELEYGRARVEFADYIDKLREDANKLTWEEFKKNKAATIGRGIKHIPGMTKSAKATLDDSALFNQGMPVLMTHPTIWTRNALNSFRDIGRTFKGKNVLEEVSADIVSRPNYDNYLKDNLGVSVVEEAYPDSKLLEKIPIAGRFHKAADAAFTAFQYRNRADLYDFYAELLKKSGVDEVTGHGIGQIANTLTGRGNLGGLERVGNTVNNVFFSPRFVKSKIDIFTHPLGFDLATGKIDPFARKQAAINLMKIIAATAGIMVTAKAMGANVETDPRSTDFAKLKIGNTRFNFTGGLNSLVTLAARLITQETKNTKGEIVSLNSGKYGSATTWDVFRNFMEGKLSPVAGVVRDYLKGQDFSGNRVTVGNELQNLVVPLPITNFQELAQDPNSAPIIAAMISDGLGLFVNTYSNDPDLRKIKNDMLQADEKFSPERTSNFYNTINKAKGNGVITKEQADQYIQNFEEMQKTAKEPEKNTTTKAPHLGSSRSSSRSSDRNKDRLRLGR